MARTPPSSSRGRAGSRRSSGGGASSQQAVLIGAVAVAVLLVVIYLINSGGGAKPPAAPAPAAQPKPVPVSAPAAPAPRPGKLLKPPKTTAPELSQATLAEQSKLLIKITELHNAGVTARLAGDNQTARAREGEAKLLLDQWKDRIAPQLLWQEEAQMDDWQQPPEYLTLERIYGEYQTLTKKVRMGGG